MSSKSHTKTPPFIHFAFKMFQRSVLAMAIRMLHQKLNFKHDPQSPKEGFPIQI